MGKHTSRSRVDRWLALVTVLLVMLAGAVWAREHWGPPGGATLSVPIPPGRVLYLTIWKPGPAYHPRDRDHHDRLLPSQGPMMIAIWYQNTTTVATRRLALFGLPMWPLMLLATSTTLVLLGGWWKRRRAINHRRAAPASSPPVA